ncbi:MAG TPA: alanine--tRNA ligase-related protein, partial [Patescibacteria group bacterium]
NWWSRSGVPEKMPPGEPGGPDSEIFWDFGEKLGHHEASPFQAQPCHVNCDCGRFLEIGNSVFMEYRKTKTGFEPLPQKNVDFGGGLERMAAAAQNDPDIFKIDTFRPLIQKIQEFTKADFGYHGDKSFDSLYRPGVMIEQELEQSKNFGVFLYSARVIADHIRAATFILGDERGIAPSNLEAGYVLRRLIRRAIRHAKIIGISSSFTAQLGKIVIDQFADEFPSLLENEQLVLAEFTKEEEKFSKTLEKGLREFEKLAADKLDGKDAFILFSTYGFPLEMTQELAEERGLNVDEEKFRQEFKKHQNLSRTASAGKFKGGLADHSTETTRLHTAHHLLLAALQKTLGPHVQQKGSNITAKRLRIDFSHPDKLTDEQLETVQNLVNQAIQNDLAVDWEELPLAEARQRQATGVFEHKYAERVKVYKIYDPTSGEIFSQEICGGPHVKKTSELGQFSIKKEEASSGGVRRIKAELSKS